MKTGLTLILLCCLCTGCGKSTSRPKAGDHDITVWRMQESGGLRTQIAGIPLSEDLVDRILQKATQECNDINLIVSLSPGVSVTNAFALLAMAERHGITNAIVRMNQTPPSRASTKDDGVIYDVNTKDAPTSKRTLP